MVMRKLGGSSASGPRAGNGWVAHPLWFRVARGAAFLSLGFLVPKAAQRLRQPPVTNYTSTSSSSARQECFFPSAGLSPLLSLIDSRLRIGAWPGEISENA